MLKFLSDQKLHSFKEVLEFITDYFNLTETQKNKLLPNGSIPVINNRVRWAKYYLKKGRFLDNPKKGYLTITQKGIEIVKKNPDEIKISFHEQVLENDEIQNVVELDAAPEEVGKKEIQTLVKLDSITENVEKKAIKTLEKLDSITENVENKIVQTLEKLNNVPMAVEKNETKTPERLEHITNNVEHIEIQTQEQLNSITESVESNEKQTPDKLIQIGYESIKDDMGIEILDKLRKSSILFFEKIVLKLLSNMGYGNGEVFNRSIDGRIDGFINPDRLGFDRIYFRANRFKDNIPITASMIRDFVGTLELNGLNKGVFITTSNFQKNFEQDLQNVNKNIILIEGNKLGELMIEYNIGVKSKKIYEIKKIDSDFFNNDL